MLEWKFVGSLKMIMRGPIEMIMCVLEGVGVRVSIFLRVTSVK